MPSFDIVSEIDEHELTNALDQANREVGTRYDFKGSKAEFKHVENTVLLEAQTEFQLQQMVDLLYQKMAKRGLELGFLEAGKAEERGQRAYQTITLKQGIDRELAKQITTLIKESKIKVQSAVQGEQVRVTGKKRDDLQEAIALLRKADIKQPLQFQNFRD
ncbi:MAG: YajQ family cyclic di-GMP-binding protein [Gammaproteobacteria bacterium]